MMQLLDPARKLDPRRITTNALSALTTDRSVDLGTYLFGRAGITIGGSAP
jgi:hypothetical protein